MRLAQHDRPDKNTNDQPNARDSCIKDPNPREGKSECRKDDAFLIFSQRANKVVVVCGEGILKRLRRVWAHRGCDGGGFVDEHILVDNCADYDGDCSRDLTQEGECCGSGSHVGGVNICLQSNEGCLKERACANTCDELIDD